MRLLVLAFAFLFSAAKTYALDIPNRPDGYVHDQAAMLSSDFRQQLEIQLASFEQVTSNQIVVATFPSLEGESLEDFAVRLFEAWHIGQKDKNNGALFLIFKNDRAMRIEVGYGLEGVLPDALAGQIIRDIVTPYFKEGNFDAGVGAGVNAIESAVKGEYQEMMSPPRKRGSSEEMLWNFIFTAAFFLFLVDLIRYGIYHTGHRLYRHGYTFWEWWLRFGFLLFVLNLISRVIFYSMLTSRGGYSGRRSGFSSGGFREGGGISGGGFSGGGGMSGGGGASGRW